MNKVAVTGSRVIKASYQWGVAGKILESKFTRGAELHHGCCVGFDESMAMLGIALGYWIVAHPPINRLFLSEIALQNSNEARHPAEYLVRNQQIVDECDFLIAAPITKHEILRSGTWSTIRYAKKAKLAMVIVSPDGEATKYGD